MRSRMIAGAAAVVLAVVGTVLIVGYARGADARATAGQQLVQVLVVSAVVPRGTPADQLGNLVAVTSVPVDVAVTGAVTKLDQITGTVADVDLQPGEQLLSSRFVRPDALTTQGGTPLPAGLVAVTVPLDPTRALGGAVAAGDRVGVLVSYDLDTQPARQTHLQLNSLLVTAVQGSVLTNSVPATGTAPASTPVSAAAATPVQTNGLLVTLALPAADAEQLVFGAEFGKLWLAEEPKGTPSTGTRVVTPEKALTPERGTP